MPTQWLPQIVMAQVEDWFGLAGVAWLSGLHLHRPRGHPLDDRPAPRQSPRGRAGHRGGDPRVGRRHVDATAGAQLPAHRRDHRGLAATREDHKVRWWLVPLAWLWAMVHGMWPVGIIIGLVALLGIALDRAVPRAGVAEPRRHPRAVGRGHRPDPRGPGPLLRGARGQLARPLLRRVAAAGLPRRRQHRAAHPRRRAAPQDRAPRRRGALDPPAPHRAGRRVGALHRPHGERRRHDARPPGRRRAAGRPARAAARTAPRDV